MVFNAAEIAAHKHKTLLLYSKPKHLEQTTNVRDRTDIDRRQTLHLGELPPFKRFTAAQHH